MHLLRSALALVAALVSMAVWAAGHPLISAQAPDFAARAFAGGNVRLSEYRGDVVVLTFWGSNCGPCGAQLQALGRSYETYQSAGLRMFGISVDDNQARAQEYARTHPVGFPLLADPEKKISRLYQVDNLPMTVLIDRNGAVRHVYRDYSNKSEALYLEQLRALLNE